jgi:hypothetical protein
MREAREGQIAQKLRDVFKERMKATLQNSQNFIESQLPELQATKSSLNIYHLS